MITLILTHDQAAILAMAIRRAKRSERDCINVRSTTHVAASCKAANAQHIERHRDNLERLAEVGDLLGSAPPHA